MIFKIAIILTIIYLLWAVAHHKRKKSLTLPILVEYLLTATLVVILLLGVIT